MKFDKELVLKHKFWLLLAVTLPLSLGALFLLVTSVSGDITRTRTGIETELKKLKKAPTIKTPAEIAAVRREADIEKAKEKHVHEKAYEKQADLFTWPDRIEKEFNFLSGLFAQQIKVNRGEQAAEAPKDEDRLIHGRVLPRKGESFIEIEGNDKKVYTVFRSMKVVTNTVEGDDKVKEVLFKDLKAGDRVAVAFHRGKYFNEPLTDSEQTAYTNLGVYLSQIDPLLAQVEPMTEKGDGVVQLKGPPGWFYKKGEPLPPKTQQKFLNLLEQGWTNVRGDISEEAWIAQEDIWIQQEVYRLIRLANDYVSKFEGTGGEDKNKVYVFKNPFLELALKLTDGKTLSVTLKNRQDRQQRLDLKFRVRFNKTAPPETIAIGGEPLGPRGTDKAEAKFERILPEGTARKGIFAVEQVLTWETAAVKRIDHISIGSTASDDISHSHRTYPDGMQPLVKKDEAKGDVPAPVINRPAGPRVPRGRFPPIGDFPGGGGGPGGNNLTEHGLIRNRYVELTPQVSRRLPVALSLIVDQDHIDRVQTAFNNSKLRFLTTQVLLNRYPGSLRPQLPLDTEPARVGTQNPRFPGGPNVLRRPPRPQEQPSPGTAGSDDMETNIEMVIYGIVTLYERYPPPLQIGPAADAK